MREVPAEVREVLRDYLPQVTKLFGTTLEAVILYGSAAGGEYLPGRSNINLLMVLSRHEGTELQRYATLHQPWQKERIVVPLFLTQAELRSSLDGQAALEHVIGILTGLSGDLAHRVVIDRQARH